MDKRESFRVNIRRQQRDGALVSRRKSLLRRMDLQEKLMSEDNFIGLCHELILGVLKGNAKRISMVLDALSRDRLLMLRNRVIEEMGNTQIEKFLFKLLGRDVRCGFTLETIEQVLDVLVG